MWHKINFKTVKKKLSMKLKGNTKSILNSLYLRGENLFSKRNIQYKCNNQKISSSPNEMKLPKRLSSTPRAYQVDISNDLANMIKQTPYKVTPILYETVCSL